MTESGTVAHSPAVTLQRVRRVASPEYVARAENGRVPTAMAAARVWQTLTTAGAATVRPCYGPPNERQHL